MFSNITYLFIFFIFASIFIYILYKDKQKYTRDAAVRKLLYIKRNN